MAICFRTVSNKLTSINKFVPSRKHVGLVHVQRRLPQHISDSSVLEEVIINYIFVPLVTIKLIHCLFNIEC
jgi:hypothetical protein